MKIENAKKIEVWEFEEDGNHCFLLPIGLAFTEIGKGLGYVVNENHYWRQVKKLIAGLEASQTKTYEQLEMEANIKKLEWKIAEQQLEIERLRQKELELTKGNNNE